MNIQSTIKLNNRTHMPAFGLGVYLIKNGSECVHSCNTAIRNGYRLFDTAALYENEEGVGQSINESGLEREELFVTTKLWNTDHGYDNTLRAFDKSMNRLGLDYVDLYLVHYPVEGKRMDTWKAMEVIVKDERCKAIGVSNYMSSHLQELIDGCTVLPSVNQIEMHPYCYGGERLKTVELCKANQIAIQCYSPLVRATKFEDPNLMKVAHKYNKSGAQLLVRWALQHGFSVIPKSNNPERIKENCEVFDFAISGPDMQALDALYADEIVCWDPTKTP